MLTNKEISEIYARNADSVFRLCCSFMKDKALSEDMLQETFLKLIKTRVTFASAEHEKAWLIVTASNLCKNELRRGKRLTSLSEPDEAGNEEMSPEPEGMSDEVTRAVMSLPNEYKTSVYMYYYEEYSVKEIAKYTGKSVSAVKMQLLRARDRLRKMLGEDYE